jgi:uncharacterized protein YcbX
VAKTVGKISSLTQYPVKSCGGMPLEHAEIDESGLRGDRLLFLIDENGEALSQSGLPRMALIQPSLVGSELSVLAPGQGPLEVSVVDRGALRQAKFWLDEASAVDQGDEAARWFSAFLDTPCRLMANAEIHPRTVPDKLREIFPAKQSRFTAVAPILLTSESSLADLNGRIAKPIGMNRFRQNLVIEGSAPFYEEWWARLRIGDMEFEKVISCERCGITQLNQETGERGVEPIRTLAKFHQQPGGIGGGIVFGIYFRPLQPGVLHLGDEVTVLEAQGRFLPNDRTAVVAEEDLPVPPIDL